MGSIVEILADGLVYPANGVLVVGYFLAERAAHLAALAAALLIAATFDRLIQSQAVFAPSRYDDSAVKPSQTPRTAQVITGIAIGLWLAATWSFQSFVPAIGAAMWLASLLALLVMPQQRWSLLWSTKGYLILYSFAVIGFRLYLWQAARISPHDLALVFGGAEPAARTQAWRRTLAASPPWARGWYGRSCRRATSRCCCRTGWRSRWRWWGRWRERRRW